MPLLFNIFFAAVINVASTRFKADKDIMDALVHLGKKKRAGGGRGEATAAESLLATPLWGMLFADDAGVVSQFTKQCVHRQQGCLQCGRASFRLGVESTAEVVPKSAVATRCASEQKENIEICRLLMTDSQSQVCFEVMKRSEQMCARSSSLHPQEFSRKKNL